jgi:WhiB family redox-sensing transcriptional regulator
MTQVSSIGGWPLAALTVSHTTYDTVAPKRVADETPAWHAFANCLGVDGDLFFPERGAPRSDIEEAKKVCRACVVREECLEYALTAMERHGIWGGLSERERRRIRRTRAVAR